MALPRPQFSPQSQSSYGHMVTRIGTVDFGTKPKFAHEKLMPGFVPFQGAILLKSSEYKVSAQIREWQRNLPSRIFTIYHQHSNCSFENFGDYHNIHPFFEIDPPELKALSRHRKIMFHSIASLKTHNFFVTFKQCSLANKAQQKYEIQIESW